MKLEKLALIGEVVGAIAIVVSLLVVAIEVRQNTVSQNAAIYQLMSQQVRQIALDVPNEVRLKIQSGEGLSDSEWYDYIQWFAGAMRTYESWWKQHDLGIIDDETFDSYITHMHISLRNQRIRDFWRDERLYEVLPGFEAYVADYLAENPAELL